MICNNSTRKKNNTHILAGQARYTDMPVLS